MGTTGVSVKGTTTAAPEVVHRLLLDGTTWTDWAPFEKAEIEAPASDGGIGVGSRRYFKTGRNESHEEVVESIPGRRYSYTLIEGLPLDGYRADVDLTPTPDGGTEIHWHSSFTPRRAGTGWFYRLILTTFIKRCVKGLAAHAPTVAPAAA